MEEAKVGKKAPPRPMSGGGNINYPFRLRERRRNTGSFLPLGEGQGVRAVGKTVAGLSLGWQLNCHPNKTVSPIRTCRPSPSP